MDEKQLIWALQTGDMEEVENHLKTEEDVNRILNSGRRPLHHAADYGQIDVMEYLISKGAKVDAIDKNGMSPLIFACYEGHTAAVKLLLEKGADKYQRSLDGTLAIDTTEKQEIKALLK